MTDEQQIMYDDAVKQGKTAFETAFGVLVIVDTLSYPHLMDEVNEYVKRTGHVFQ